MPKKKAPPAARTDLVYDAEREKNENVIGRRIAEARKRKGLSLAALADKLQNYGVYISTGGAGKWETGYCVPHAYQLAALCCALDIDEPVSYFMRDYVPPLNDAGMKKLADYKADLIASGRYAPAPAVTEVTVFLTMPMALLPASAGPGNFVDDENFEPVDFPADKVPKGADFCLRVSGDSMEPVYSSGQLVWVQRCETLRPGEVGLFVYDGESYIKLYDEREPEQGTDAEPDRVAPLPKQPVLVSYNRAYAPRRVSPDLPFRIVGRIL